jgi:predicted NUDIX family NTP pyrophosphohydrolase
VTNEHGCGLRLDILQTEQYYVGFSRRLGMAKRSAGILMYRRGAAGIELLLVHPGGPFWTKKDHGAWSIPKGEYDAEEEPLACAIREFAEELGSAPQAVDVGAFLELGELVLPSRKVITAFAIAGEFDPAKLKSNHFEMEWPPRSGRKQSFPEVDRAAWFAADEAREKIQPGQSPFIDRLLATLSHKQR